LVGCMGKTDALRQFSSFAMVLVFFRKMIVRRPCLIFDKAVEGAIAIMQTRGHKVVLQRKTWPPQ
jgi:hypothetical protein